MTESAEVDAKGPVTDRGRRTRARLIAAARTVFEDCGFLDARITDIAETAGVAYGTFYTYFATKEDIFREVANSVQAELLQPRDGDGDGDGDAGADGEVARAAAGDLTPAQKIEVANRRYLEAYQKNARIMAVLEQVATFSDELLEIRKQTRVAFVERSARSIARWQQQGLADPDVDAYYAASALGSMVDRFAYVWLVLEGDFEFEKSVETLTRLWVQAIKLTDPPARRRPRRGADEAVRGAP